MELHQLEYLVAVAEEASFTKAAARVHIAQPGVSAQIRRLESELGHALFDRSGGSVRLTDAGARVLPPARAALAAVHEIAAVAEQLRGVLRGRVAVGMMPSCPPEVVTGTLAAFHDEHPGVEISLVEAPSADLIAGLRDGAIDLAVVGFASALDRGIEVQVINDDVLVAAVAPGSDLARRTSISLRALAEHPLICLPRGAGIRAGLDEGCAAAGVRAHIALEASNPVVVGDFAARSLGVAVLPHSYVRTRDDLHAIRISRPALRARVGVAWRADGRLSPAATALVELWRRVGRRSQ
ncbi:LysR family transcriptional regulator [Mycobacterium heidelbergense]|uniref:LysR family transcriptional regulator n=1 Tax=Mycobacterium heidelbergense TaxID=53376 RepID=UPI003CF9CD0E